MSRQSATPSCNSSNSGDRGTNCCECNSSMFSGSLSVKCSSTLRFYPWFVIDGSHPALNYLLLFLLLFLVLFLLLFLLLNLPAVRDSKSPIRL